MSLWSWSTMRNPPLIKSVLASLILASIYTGCENPSRKSLEDREWTEFGLYVIEDMDTDRSGEESGGETSGDTAGEMLQAGDTPSGGMIVIGGDEIQAGDSQGGEALGGESSGGDATVLEADPLIPFEHAWIPPADQVALINKGTAALLFWAQDDLVWSRVFSTEVAAEEPINIYAHSAKIKSIFSAVTRFGEYLILTDVDEAVYVLSIYDLSGDQAQSVKQLALKGPIKVTSSEESLLIVGSTEEPIDGDSVEGGSQVGWIALSELDLISSASEERSPVLAPSSWPLPDDITWISGSPVFRYHLSGQCAYLSPSYEILGSTPCLAGQAYYLSSPNETLMAHLDRAGSLQVTQAEAPDLESSYVVAQLDLSSAGESGEAVPLHGSFRADQREVSVIGRRLSEESDGMLRDRLIVLDPLGMWVSDAGWAVWPFEGVRSIVRRGREAWMFIFDDQHVPRRVRARLQVNSFNERVPFGLSHDEQCRPTVERCDGFDNNCDGIIDNGLCCATTRDPYEVYFIPSSPPREFFVSDVELADASRYALRVDDDRWEMREILYSSASRNLIFHHTISGAYDAAGFTTAGEYSVLVAQDAQGSWKAFWSHYDPSAPIKDPEDLGCERVFAVGNVGYQPTSTSAVALCDDRVVHLRADLDEEGQPLPSETHTQPFEALTDVLWGTLVRNNSRGEASIVIAFQSLAGQSWEVSKINISKIVRNRLAFSLPQSLNSKLGLSGQVQPEPIYLHRDDSPGIPEEFPLLEINSSKQSGRVNAFLNGRRQWLPLRFGKDVDRIDYTELPSKIIAEAPSDDGMSSDFFISDLKDYTAPNYWVTLPTIKWESPLLDDQEIPENPAPMIWSLIHGNYYNYLALMFEAGETADTGQSLPRGVWAVRLYSITDCLR